MQATGVNCQPADKPFALNKERMSQSANQFLEVALPPTIPTQTTILGNWRIPTANQTDAASIEVEEEYHDKREQNMEKHQSLSNEEDNVEESLVNTSETDSESVSPTSIYKKPKKRPFKDILFTLAYTFCFLLMFSAGLVFVASKSSTIPVSKTLFLPLWKSAGPLVLLILASILLSLVWLYLLASFSNIILILTGVFLPVCITGISIGNFVRFLLASPSPLEETEFKTLASLCIIGLLGGLYTGWLAWRNRRMVANMNVIVSLATEVLMANSSLFVLSASLSIFHLAFSVFWLWLFAHIFMSGVLIDFQVGTMAPSAPWIAAYFILLYFWTSAILQNLEKVTVSSVVGEWYFDRGDHRNTTDETWFHFRYVSCRSFGPVAFASLVLGLVRSVQFIVKQVEKYGSRKFLNYRLVSWLLSFLSMVLDDLSAYTLVYVGLTGDSLLSSAYHCSRLFRRSLILGLLTANMSRLMSFVGKMFVSTIIGLGLFWSTSGSQTPSTGNEWVLMMVATVIPYYVMGILTHVVETTIDATFICYLIDLNQNTCSYEKAHRIFSASLK